MEYKTEICLLFEAETDGGVVVLVFSGEDETLSKFISFEQILAESDKTFARESSRQKYRKELIQSMKKFIDKLEKEL